MMRNFRTAALTGLLAFAGLAATADRADAQMYYSYYPGSTYYYNVTPYGGYQTYYSPGTTYSYYSPYNNTNWNYTTPGTTYSSYYTTPYNTGYYNTPYTTWDGNNWGYSPYNSGYYNSPAMNYYNTYRAVRGMIRR